MADQLMIVMLNTDPQSAAEAGAPLFRAAMDYFITY